MRMICAPAKNGQRSPTHGEQLGGAFAKVVAMNVIALTVFVGLVLVILFALLFVLQIWTHPPGGGQEALLPLADENQHEAKK